MLRTSPLTRQNHIFLSCVFELKTILKIKNNDRNYSELSKPNIHIKTIGKGISMVILWFRGRYALYYFKKSSQATELTYEDIIIRYGGKTVVSITILYASKR